MMKVWVGAGCWLDTVKVFSVKPVTWNKERKSWGDALPFAEQGASICRAQIQLLLKGKIKRLPPHDSKTLLEIELTARVVRRKK